MEHLDGDDIWRNEQTLGTDTQLANVFTKPTFPTQFNAFMSKMSYIPALFSKKKKDVLHSIFSSS